MTEDTQIRAIVRGLERVTEHVVTKITLDVTANLVETTPVDTGWARANWVPAIGAPVIQDLRGVPTTAQNVASMTGEQQQALVGIVTDYRLSRGAVFVSNNVPYVPRLNDGSSTQAPSGFVQRAVQKAVTQDIRGFKA
mgnify:CR=1 FL=1